MKRFAYILLLAGVSVQAQQIQTYRPFGTLRQQADLQQKWLMQRMNATVPTLMQKYGVEMWIVPMREYNEDPVFSSIVSPTTFAARRRTIYLFSYPCVAQRKALACDGMFEAIALGGTSQGGVYKAVRSTKPAAGPAGAQQQAQAELWGDEQWQVLKKEIEKLAFWPGQQSLFDCWINEVSSGSDNTWWERSLNESRGADIVIVLYNGQSGGAIKDGPIGICHAELDAVLTDSRKVRVIQLPLADLPKELQSMTREQQVAAVNAMRAKREAIQTEFKEKTKGFVYKPYVSDGPPPVPKQ